MLTEANAELNRIREHQSTQSLLISELETQRDNYKKAYDEANSVTSTAQQERTARRSLEKLESEFAYWKSRAELLEEKFNALGEDRRNVEK